MMKVLNTILRVKPEDTFAFFEEVPSHLNNLISLTCFPGVCYFLAKMLNELDSENYRKQKLEITYKIIEKLQESVNDNSFLCRVEIVEEIFSKNRFRSDDVDEIKIISQPLVDSKVINWFIDKIINPLTFLELSNSIFYLLLVVRRMNVDEEKDPYNYYE